MEDLEQIYKSHPIDAILTALHAKLLAVSLLDISTKKSPML